MWRLSGWKNGPQLTASLSVKARSASPSGVLM